MNHPARRFAPKTVRQDWNAVRQELEQVSDRIGIRKFMLGLDQRFVTSPLDEMLMRANGIASGCVWRFAEERNQCPKLSAWELPPFRNRDYL